MPGTASANRLPAYLLLAAASCAFSGLAILRDPLLDAGGVLQLFLAETARERGVEAALQLGSWPVHALLVAAVHTLTGLPMLASAHALDAALMALLTVSFARLTELLGAERRFFYWGALALLLFPQLNEYRGQVGREFGLWAFTLASLVPLARYTASHAWQDALSWAMLLAIAAAFGPEALAFALLMPLACLARGAEGPRAEAVIRLYAVLGGLALVPLLAASRLGTLPALVDAALQPLGILARETASGFARAAARHGALVLDPAARTLAPWSLAAGLAGILLVELLRTLGTGPSLLLGWAVATRHARVPATGRGLQRAFAAAGLLLAVAFVARRQYLPPTQLMPLALALLVPCSFAARELLITAGQSRRPRLARAGLAAVLVALLAQGFVNVGSRTSYLVDSVGWMERTLPAGSTVFSNDLRLAWYSGARVDWTQVEDAGRRIAAGTAPLAGVDFWLIHLDRGDDALARAVALYGRTLRTVARFEGADGQRVLVLRPATVAP